jgi:type I restriction enzyme, S subunit
LIDRALPGFAFKSGHLGDDGTPVVKIGNITDDGAVDLNLVQRLPDSYLDPEKFRLSNRDIVLAMTGATAGKAGRISARTMPHSF